MGEEPKVIGLINPLEDASKQSAALNEDIKRLANQLLQQTSYPDSKTRLFYDSRSTTPLIEELRAVKFQQIEERITSEIEALKAQRLSLQDNTRLIKGLDNMPLLADELKVSFQALTNRLAIKVTLDGKIKFDDLIEVIEKMFPEDDQNWKLVNQYDKNHQRKSEMFATIMVGNIVNILAFYFGYIANLGDHTPAAINELLNKGVVGMLATIIIIISSSCVAGSVLKFSSSIKQPQKKSSKQVEQLILSLAQLVKVNEEMPSHLRVREDVVLKINQQLDKLNEVAQTINAQLEDKALGRLRGVENYITVASNNHQNVGSYVGALAIAVEEAPRIKSLANSDDNAVLTSQIQAASKEPATKEMLVEIPSESIEYEEV